MNLTLFQEIIFTLTFVVLAVYQIFRVITGLRIIQQSHYSNTRFINWYEKRMGNFEEISIYLLTFVMFFLNIAVFHIIAILIFSYYLLKKEKVKKNLIISGRIIRLFIFYLLISFSLVYILVVFLNIDRTPSIFLNTILAYFILSLVNFFDKPISNTIKKIHKNKAKKKLKSIEKLTTIGVTGSYGKTTTKHLLNSFLNIKYNSISTPKSFNTAIDISKTIENDLQFNTEMFITEMGAYKKGEIKDLCDFVEPTHGILTTIGVQHLSSFKTQKNITKTKFELIESLPKNGYGIINLDNENVINYESKFECNIVTFGINNKNAEYRAENIIYNNGFMNFDLIISNKVIDTFKTKLLGIHNIYNILASIALAHKLGVDLVKIKDVLLRIQAIKHRLEYKKENNLVILDDTHNSNPEGANYALEVISYFKGKKYLITPGFVDLGKSMEYFNHQFGFNMVGKIDVIILVGIEKTEPIFRGLLNNKFLGEIHRVDSIENAMGKFKDLYNDQEAVLLIENDLPDCYN